MADNPDIQDGRDRAKVSGSEDYEMRYFVQKHGLTMHEVRMLIAKHGNDREALEKAVAELVSEQNRK